MHPARARACTWVQRPDSTCLVAATRVSLRLCKSLWCVVAWCAEHIRVGNSAVVVRGLVLCREFACSRATVATAFLSSRLSHHLSRASAERVGAGRRGTDVPACLQRLSGKPLLVVLGNCNGRSWLCRVGCAQTRTPRHARCPGFASLWPRGGAYSCVWLGSRAPPRPLSGLASEGNAGRPAGGPACAGSDVA